jgi:hypothetical protein
MGTCSRGNPFQFVIRSRPRSSSVGASKGTQRGRSQDTWFRFAHIASTAGTSGSTKSHSLRGRGSSRSRAALLEDAGYYGFGDPGDP